MRVPRDDSTYPSPPVLGNVLTAVAALLSYRRWSRMIGWS